MFCSKCGAQLANNSRFCGRCGNPIATLPPKAARGVNTVASSQSKPENITILSIVVAAVMVLSMSILPMMQLRFADREKYYTISLLGENYMAGYGIRDDIVSVSRFAFIFMLAAIIAYVFFAMSKQPHLSLISSIINVGILFAYSSHVHSAWTGESTSYTTCETQIDAGSLLCLACAVLLVIFSCMHLDKKSADRRR